MMKELLTRKEALRKANATRKLMPVETIDILLYIPSEDRFLKIDDGTGDNLLDEDIEVGYNDYLYTYFYVNNGEGYETDEDDAPMIMFNNREKDYYDAKIDEAIVDTLEMVYGDNQIPDFVICKK